MKNINAQEWLDKKYPVDGKCQRKKDTINKGKRRENITYLDIRKEKIGNFFSEKNLIEALKLEGFSRLRSLIISSHELTDLDLSDCSNLEELNCQNNQLTSLNVNKCSNLKKINCYDNNLKSLDLSTCTKLAEINCATNNSLEEVDISSCLKLTEISPEFTRKGNKLMKNISRITLAGENDIRNILIVGMTGNGKSTLANVMSNTEKFEEGDFSTSVTKNFQRSDIFEWKGKKYRAIDNIGFGDSDNISEEDVLNEIGKGIHSAKGGINQVLFVFKGRFSSEQLSAFNTFKDFIAETGVTRVVTLVRTNFSKFSDVSQEACEKDRQALLEESEKIKEIINSCNGGVIYIDNPSTFVSAPDDEDEDERKQRKEKIDLRKKIREESRKVVLDHLVKNCSEIYRVEKWESIHGKVSEYMKKKEEIENKSISSEEKQVELENERKKLAEDVRVRLGMSPVTLEAYIEVETRNCCRVS